MGAIVDFVKPILFALLNSRQMKEFVIELLERYSKQTDNDIDDVLVQLVKERLLKEAPAEEAPAEEA